MIDDVKHAPLSLAGAIEPRVLDDLAPQVTVPVDEAFAEASKEVVAVGGPPMDPAEFETAYADKIMADEAVEQDIRNFHSSLVKICWQWMRAASDLREEDIEDGGAEFSRMMDLIRARSSNRNRISYDDKGVIRAEYKDGHRALGLLLGWCSQNIRTATAHFNNTQFGVSPRFYSIRMQGDRAGSWKSASLKI